MNAVLNTLSKRGMRITRPRKLLIEELLSKSGPRTHAELAECLTDKGIDQATVYRNLLTFCDLGFMRRTELGDHLWRFEWNDESPSAVHEHSHFVCEHCGSVTCLPDAMQHGWNRGANLEGVGQVTELLFKGICEPCLLSQHQD